MTMNRPQLIVRGALALAMSSVALACSRSDTQDQARHAAAEVRTVAERAGEHFADGWLTTKVQAEYCADRDIKARYIDVSTRDGVVTLGGYVDSDQARAKAEQVARNTDGVKHVENKLLIGRAPNSSFPSASGSTSDAVATTGRVAERAAEHAAARVDDARITTMIQAKYFLDSGVKGRHIDVDTRDGVVTLRGEVSGEAERSQALLLARNTDGVQRVEDNLTVDAALDSSRHDSNGSAASTSTSVGQGLDDTVITGKIKTKFVGDEQVKATDINVTTNNGVVVLEGTVPSAIAKRRALTLARETEGVSQ